MDAIANAIRLTNPKGTNLSTIGGSIYLRDVQNDPKHEKHLKNVQSLYIVIHKKTPGAALRSAVGPPANLLTIDT